MIKECQEVGCFAGSCRETRPILMRYCVRNNRQAVWTASFSPRGFFYTPYTCWKVPTSQGQAHASTALWLRLNHASDVDADSRSF